MSYTKGPWRISRPVGGNYKVRVCAEHASIATVHAYLQQDGNAHLIAAAPELLEACQAALLTLNINRKLVTCPPLTEKLKAAIDKATGAGMTDQPSPSELDYNARRMQSMHNRRKYVDGCKTCEDIQTKSGGHGPAHDASARCESGCHSHCSCDCCY